MLRKNFNPILIYKEYGADLISLRKELNRIKYDDSELGRLFHEKIQELNNYFELIKSRNSAEFNDLSKKIFGAPTEKDIEEIKQKILPAKISGNNEKMGSGDLQQLFERTLLEYGIHDWRAILKKNLLSKCVVNKNKKILIRKEAYFSKNRVRDLVIHEIETHLITSENGSRQKYKLFNYGFANYLETQEGLAMYNVVNQGNIHIDEHYKDILTEAIFQAQDLSLVELYHYIKAKNLTDNSAMDICFRVKRGMGDTAQKGAFTKDYCYFSGRKKIQQFVDQGGNLADLYFGKYSVDDINLIKNISIFKKPPLLPKWLQSNNIPSPKE